MNCYSKMELFVKIKETDNRLLEQSRYFFIIAEAGINHNGDVNLAKKLIDAAKEASVDAVVFQTFKAENVVTRADEKA